MVFESTAKKSKDGVKPVVNALDSLMSWQVSLMDLLPHDDLSEKLIDLVVNGEPGHHDPEIAKLFGRLSDTLTSTSTDQVRVVVFGGGTGLSNIIGGDCRPKGWANSPFSGLKEVFPRTRSVVCVTDDGGSTGELIKDLPLVAIGDIRHVLLSSIQLSALQRTYQVSVGRAVDIAAELAKLFNLRYEKCPGSVDEFFELAEFNGEVVPTGLREIFTSLIEKLFTDPRLSCTLNREHCLGNLIVASAIYQFLDPAISNEDLTDDPQLLHDPIFSGLQLLCNSMGAGPRSVLPCTTTPSRLRIVYSNGVQTIGESKSSSARRGVPVESVHVDFCGEPQVYPEIIHDIEHADILILAPGSLYSSIIPVFKVPGLAEAVRKNRNALKLLISNLWVQAGETDLSRMDPERKFRVSDMIRAYEQNIPGGIKGLFDQVLCISLRDVPASVIQQYAVESKIPIYLDRDVVRSQGYTPVECDIYSKQALVERGVIQHDPAMLATAVQVLYASRECFSKEPKNEVASDLCFIQDRDVYTGAILPNNKYKQILKRLESVSIDCAAHCTCDCFGDEEKIRLKISEIIWKHQDIPLSHLDFFSGINCIDEANWNRDQKWDNVYSFYDPDTKTINIRRDQFHRPVNLEVALLIAMGESLLGQYAKEKRVSDVQDDNLFLGKVYHLYLSDIKNENCFFDLWELNRFLRLARMHQGKDCNHYTRLINADEGFTPPGLLMGLLYAWYLENRIATHIEYKMTVMKIPQTDLIPEQKRMVGRREKMISFFRDVVFGKSRSL